MEHEELIKRLRLFSDGGKYPIADEAADALEACAKDAKRLDALQIWAVENDQPIAQQIADSIISGMDLRQAIDAAIAREAK